jgi:hypothetical protein
MAAPGAPGARGSPAAPLASLRSRLIQSAYLSPQLMNPDAAECPALQRCDHRLCGDLRRKKNPDIGIALRSRCRLERLTAGLIVLAANRRTTSDQIARAPKFRQTLPATP